jgi:hypothetical protein
MAGPRPVALAVIVNLEHWDWEVPADTPLAVRKTVARQKWL